MENDARRPENRLRRRRLTSEEERPEEPQQSLEDALDSLLQDVEDEEASSTEQPAVLPTSNATEQEPTQPVRPLTRAETQSQRTRERFARVFGSREDLQQDDYESPLTTMYGRAYDRYRQAEERRADGTTAAPAVDGLSVQERRDIEEQLLWGVMRDSQAMSESLEREGDVWSYAPVHGNIQPLDFTAGAPQPIDLTNPMAPGSLQEMTEAAMRMLAQQENRRQLLTDTPSTSAAPSDPITATSSASPRVPGNGNSGGFSEVRSSIQQITSELQRLRIASEALSSARLSMHARPPPTPTLSLDNQPDRPPPATDEEMTKVLACQVCYQQLADTALLPCGHMVMCRWCADVVIPVRHSHLPIRPTKCPMCRKAVKQRFRIHM